ncbi:MAG TPA: Hpt domain-containing protein [Anaerolineales bacterium]|nr:Hpt domain-containing protein [Anaerolineales bacterium]
MADEAVIDRGVLNNLFEAVGGDKAFLTELIDTFFQDTPVQLAAIRQALSMGNAEDFRRAAHSLKSNSANFGAQRLSQQSKELEELGKAGKLAGVDERLAQLEAEYAKVKVALESIRREA